MASRSHATLKSPENREVLVVGSFTPNGAGAVNQATIRGRGVVSVTRAGAAGLFTVVLRDGFVREIAFLGGGVIHDTGADFRVDQRGAATTGVTGGVTLQIVLEVANVDTDLAAGVANRVSFACVMEESNVYQ